MAGAILAEYLVTSDGLGWIVYMNRGSDFGVLWIVGLLSGLAGLSVGRVSEQLAARAFGRSARVESFM